MSHDSNKYLNDINGGARGVVVVNEGSSFSTVSSSLLLILFLLGILAVGAYFGYMYYTKRNEVATDTILEKGKAYLVATTNKPDSAESCESDKTFGFSKSGNFYITNGCSGVFVYTPDGTSKKLGVCTTNDKEFKNCDTTQMTPDLSPTRAKKTGPITDPLYTLPSLDDVPTFNSMTGFLDMTDANLSIVKQNGNCRAGNYGFYGNNMIKVSNGCKGVFAFGPLIGKCESTDANTEKRCPIGSIDSSGDGLLLQDVKPLDTSSYCNQGQKYGFKSLNVAFKDPTVCQIGGVTMGEYNIGCDKDGNCPVNTNTIQTT
ncbi:hypothetical protein YASMINEVIRUS_279 [Yasminevirus sp. GU-2018]|uniref:Uncharacterized protein n=1 Tax=Yasminevirus sp. GU-2018 TaxID=2420051 RepID=A0A5K0U9M1_9VIRU|nr:hypothetical protein YASMINEVIRUS_279 [Yasminevirus sp. GU-2018]